MSLLSAFQFFNSKKKKREKNEEKKIDHLKRSPARLGKAVQIAVADLRPKAALPAPHVRREYYCYSNLSGRENGNPGGREIVNLGDK